MPRKKQTKFHDPTQQSEGKKERWKNEPLSERHESLIVHTKRPFNAEPTNLALQEMITPKGQHYRRTHAPVPLVDESKYSISLEMEGGSGIGSHTLDSLESKYGSCMKEIYCTMMCTGNRRGEYNEFGMTAGLPWANGSISSAKWKGYPLYKILNDYGIDYDDIYHKKGYKFITFWGLDDFHISVPISKALDCDGDVILACVMNGEKLPRDHGYPIRVMVPGFVGARCVKWLKKIVLMKNEVEGPHQTGIAYKQMGPNYKDLAKLSVAMIKEMPPIDIIPVTSAITAPDDAKGTVEMKSLNDDLTVKGYAYSGGGRAIARVDVSTDNGKTWNQAKLVRAPNQGIRSNKAWCWSQWEYNAKWKDVIANVDSNTNELTIRCKAVDDQYNQQPHSVEPIWNIRGILNTSWPKCVVKVTKQSKL